MFATFKLLNAYFWKTIYGPVLAFIFPIALIAILGSIFRLEYVYPGIIALSIMFLGVIALPLAIMELKSSSLFKYIGSSPVNPIKFTTVVIGFYIMIAIITGVVIFLATMAIFPNKVFAPNGFRHGVMGGIFTWVGAASFYVSALIHLVFVVATGLVIATFSKTPQQALTIALVVVLPSMFLSGMVISVDIIASNPVLNWISRFIPYRYSTGNLIVSATPIDQLNSAIDFWLNEPFDSSRKLNERLDNGYLNNLFDQLIWPFSGSKAEVNGVPVLDGATGYVGFIKSGLQTSDLKFKGIPEPTLYNLLLPNWRAMELTSYNNIYDFVNLFGVRKLPSVDAITAFTENYFRGVDASGNPLNVDENRQQLLNRVSLIGSQITQGDFRWLEVFTNQSNILYFQADKVLNFFLPIVLSAGGGWYVFRNFNWSAR